MAVDSAGVNIVLVPALLLLLGLVFYKKVWEPKRGASKPERSSKAEKATVKARAAASGSGRMGSVL